MQYFKEILRHSIIYMAVEINFKYLSKYLGMS